jgi:hypothetical protein
MKSSLKPQDALVSATAYLKDRGTFKRRWLAMFDAFPCARQVSHGQR